MNDSDTRSFEIEIQLHAEPDQVWKAITDPVELANWFPLQARVEPGAGGVLHLSWGEAFGGICRIKEWEPPNHLKTGWMDAPSGGTGTGAGESPQGTAALIRDDPGGAARVAVDYFIEGRKSGTVLRVVHSGFSRNPKWNDEYDGVSRGWTYELRSLRHYLAQHPGERRRVAWARRVIDIPAEETWSRLMGRSGLLREGRLDQPAEGDRYAIVTASGDRFSGGVQVFKKGSDFAGTVDDLNNGLFRVGIETCFGDPQVQLWVSTWGVPEAGVRALEGRLGKLLETLFPGNRGL